MLKKIESIVESFIHENSIVKLTFLVRSKKLIILPPLSSELMKGASAETEELHDIWEFYNSSKRPRMVVFKALRIQGSKKRLLVTDGEGKNGILHLDPEKTYEAEVVLLTKNNSVLKILSTPSITATTPYGEVDLELTSATIFKEASPQKADAVKVEFLTPASISKKLAVPPWLSKKTSSLGGSYSLFPTSGLIAASVLKEILEYMGAIGTKDERIPYMALRFFDIFVREIDYNIAPVTVLLGKDSKGRMRKARGIAGWVLYTPMNEKVAGTFSRLIKMGELLGVGKSRAIGLGEISASFLNSTKN